MNAQNPKTARMMKKRLSQEQVRLLEASFDAGRKLEPERKFQLARDLGVPPRQVAIWYQNKRARWKSQSLELDHGAIQVRLDAALAEKQELEREVGLLRAELKRAQDALFGFTRAQACGGSAPPVSSLSSCCDEGGGSSSLDGDVGCSGNWPNVEELYACLMAKGPVAEVVNERDYWV